MHPNIDYLLKRIYRVMVLVYNEMFDSLTCTYLNFFHSFQLCTFHYQSSLSQIWILNWKSFIIFWWWIEVKIQWYSCSDCPQPFFFVHTQIIITPPDIDQCIVLYTLLRVIWIVVIYILENNALYINNKSSSCEQRFYTWLHTGVFIKFTCLLWWWLSSLH